MNQREVVKEISARTGINPEKCVPLLKALESLLTRKLESSGSLKEFFGNLRTGLLWGDRQNRPAAEEIRKIGKEMACLTGAEQEECYKVVDALLGVWDDKWKTSPSARLKWKAASEFVSLWADR